MSCIEFAAPSASRPVLEAGAVVSNRPLESEQMPSHRNDLDWLPTTLSTAVNAFLDLSLPSVLPVGFRRFELLRSPPDGEEGL